MMSVQFHDAVSPESDTVTSLRLRSVKSKYRFKMIRIGKRSYVLNDGCLYIK